MQRINPPPRGRPDPHPSPRENGLRRKARVRSAVSRLALEADLGSAVTMLLHKDPEAAVVQPFPLAFEWTDGLDGRELTHVPLLHVRWTDASATYVDAMRRIDLERDPELSDMRRRIEAECLARGSSYEIWTEREVAAVRSGKTVMAPANGRERARFALATRHGFAGWSSMPKVIVDLAMRAGMDDVRDVDGDWICRDPLTGIPTVVMRGLQADPVTRMVILPETAALPADRNRSGRRALGRDTAPRRRLDAAPPGYGKSRK